MKFGHLEGVPQPQLGELRSPWFINHASVRHGMILQAGLFLVGKGAQISDPFPCKSKTIKTIVPWNC